MEEAPSEKGRRTLEEGNIDAMRSALKRDVFH